MVAGCAYFEAVMLLQREKDEAWKKGSEPVKEKKMEPIIFEKVKLVGFLSTLASESGCVAMEANGRVCKESFVSTHSVSKILVLSVEFAVRSPILNNSD